jgi:hypothetical protein
MGFEAAFAGIWRPWTGVRGPKSAPIEGEHFVFSFLTCASNDLVRPIHAKAMPVILASREEYDQRLTAPVPEALKLQRPLPNGLRQIVATGEREDALGSGWLELAVSFEYGRTALIDLLKARGEGGTAFPKGGGGIPL